VKNELCITKKALAETTCYEVWVAGDEASFRIEGIEPFPYSAYIDKYDGE
jgi:hypothetical protein